jgi:hypothetical protein
MLSNMPIMRNSGRVRILEKLGKNSHQDVNGLHVLDMCDPSVRPNALTVESLCCQGILMVHYSQKRR